MLYRARISVLSGREVSRENYGKVCSLGKLLNENEYLFYRKEGEQIMEAVAKGVKEGVGKCFGILKGISTDKINSYIDFSIATNMGITRNALLAHSCDAAVTTSGKYGILSEIAYSLQLDKTVIGIERRELDGLINASNEKEIIKKFNGVFLR